MTQADVSRVDELGELFVRVTGKSTVREEQWIDLHASDDAPDDLDGYKRWHAALSHHDDLRDALPDQGATL